MPGPRTFVNFQPFLIHVPNILVPRPLVDLGGLQGFPFAVATSKLYTLNY